MTTPTGRTDDQLATYDLPALLRFGLAHDGAQRRTLFGQGAVAAAVLVDRHHLPARSLAYLAQVVRAGGVRYAAGLPQPLSTPAAGELARQWLQAAAAVTTDVAGDELAARWLDAAAAVLHLRQANRS